MIDLRISQLRESHSKFARSLDDLWARVQRIRIYLKYTRRRVIGKYARPGTLLTLYQIRKLRTFGHDATAYLLMMLGWTRPRYIYICMYMYMCGDSREEAATNDWPCALIRYRSEITYFSRREKRGIRSRNRRNEWSKAACRKVA